MEHQKKPHPDNQLFKFFCQSRTPALKEIYNEFYGLIRGMVMKNQGRPEDAKDIFQEGLLVLLKYCNQSDFVLYVPLKSFFYAICRRLWLKNLEKKGRLGITFTDSWEYVDIGALLKNDQQEEHTAMQIRLLWKYIKMLPEHEQKTLRLYYFDGKSHAEIAEVMGFSGEGSARVQKFKYIQHLRKLILKDPDIYQ